MTKTFDSNQNVSSRFTSITHEVKAQELKSKELLGRKYFYISVQINAHNTSCALCTLRVLIFKCILVRHGSLLAPGTFNFGSPIDIERPCFLLSYSLTLLLVPSYSLTAACRGSTPTGGSGGNANVVFPRFSDLSCDDTCKARNYDNCDASLSISAKLGRVTDPLQFAGRFYNYGCASRGWPNPELSGYADVRKEWPYFGYCCCRR